MFDFLFNKIKHSITPRQHGFQSRKSAVLQLIDFLETARLKTLLTVTQYTWITPRLLIKFLLMLYFANFVYLG